MDAPEVAEDERVAGLRLVVGADGQPQVPRRVLVPAVPGRGSGSRPRRVGWASPQSLSQDVLPLGDERARVLHGRRVEFVPGHRPSVRDRSLRRRASTRDGRRQGVRTPCEVRDEPPALDSAPCPSATPSACSTTSTTPSARPSWRTSGPVAIQAGAGSGKTRVISHRTAYAIATDVVPADQVLVVTFTEKAAGEMVERLRGLGLPGVTARTFHAHALSQLRHFWPLHHDGRRCPPLLDSKLPLLVPARPRAARPLPVHRRPRTSPTRSSGRRAAA